ncbi:hypothetical protein [Gallibacterium anatis]|uniref:hypothetical protein n=1 Tax=Gallibacterium anatis TaxID=750 RepID=UPI00300530D7
MSYDKTPESLDATAPQLTTLFRKAAVLFATYFVGLLYLLFFALHFLGVLYDSGFSLATPFKETPWYAWMILSFALLTLGAKKEAKEQLDKIQELLSQ